jgi:hypothetical protein
MTSLNDRLRSQTARILHRPTPAGWIDAQPLLAPFATPAAIVAAVRDDTPDAGPSDEVIRAMHALAPGYPDASLVLLESLIPKALQRLGTTSPEFREEVVVNLAWAVAEFAHLDEVGHLAYRLAGRATRRTWRRQQAEQRWSDNAVALETGLELVHPARPAEDDAITSVQLDHVRRLLAEGIEAGTINAYDWQTFCDARLAPAFGFERPEIDRALLHRRARSLRRHLLHAC